MKTVVIVGGGSAAFNLLKGLRQFPLNNIVVVSTADDGGSTGVLRRELGVMPLGDIRQCLIGLSYTAPNLRELFNYRFDKGFLSGHSAGNIILSALEKITGSAEGAIAEAARILNVRGEVIFVSKQPTTLSAILADGTLLKGEHEIDEPSVRARSPIKTLQLSRAEANPRVFDALNRADAIILGPGDLYTSTFPNLLVPRVADAIVRSPAKKIFITNIMTKAGQTDGYKASDFLRVANTYLHAGQKDAKIDIVLANTKKPKPVLLARYKKEKAFFVAPDIAMLKKYAKNVIATPLVSGVLHKKAESDALSRSFVRHDPEETARIIWELIK